MDAGLLLLSIGSSAGYLALRSIVPFTIVVALKALSIAPLAILALRVLGKAAARRHAHLVLAAALTLSCLGDVLLAVDPRRYFGYALLVFLLAHLAYILLFLRSWPRPLRPGGLRLILATLVVISGLLVTSWLAPGLGPHAVPVLIYAATITAMAVSAILARFSRPFVWIGAILFMVSDSLIAAARFVTGWSPASYLIWPTYYLGQYGIAIGFLRETAGDRPDA